jgi:hypothetical protein
MIVNLNEIVFLNFCEIGKDSSEIISVRRSRTKLDISTFIMYTEPTLYAKSNNI